MRKESEEIETVSGGEKKIFLLAASILSALIMTCILLSSVLDGYFLWICLDKGFLIIYWQRKPVYEIKMRFNFRYPLWVPLLPLATIFAALLALNWQIDSKIVVHGIRIHHYHVGFLLITIATVMLIIMANASEPIVIWLCAKKTSIMEIMQGLSFIFALAGATFILLDIKDLASKLGISS
ncbi:MAG: hypothetical protein QXR06_03790 [Candidatus Bathyarchaeia archaeon]